MFPVQKMLQTVHSSRLRPCLPAVLRDWLGSLSVPVKLSSLSKADFMAFNSCVVQLHDMSKHTLFNDSW